MLLLADGIRWDMTGMRVTIPDGYQAEEDMSMAFGSMPTTALFWCCDCCE
jgi:hypothetical protein